jgi:hypothetical protein
MIVDLWLLVPGNPLHSSGVITSKQSSTTQRHLKVHNYYIPTPEAFVTVNLV